MSIDPPATIAVLGAGPIGLETTLYARYLGYDVVTFERGQPAENVRRWGHVQLFSPFRMNRSTLGLAALTAQDETYNPPDDDALLTGDAWADHYLVPLAESDLVVDSLRLNSRVIAVGRADYGKQALPGDARRTDSPFMILYADGTGQELVEQVDVVIDTSGTYGNPNHLGQGGIPARGESAAQNCIEFGLPDVQGKHRAHYEGRRILVVGAGYSAATSVVALAELATQSPTTTVTWVTRGSIEKPGEPIRRIADDRLQARDRLAAEANRLAGDAKGPVTHWGATVVTAVEYLDDARQFRVELAGAEPGTFTFDRVVANVGYRPDSELYGELQIHECYATSGPIKLAASLLSQESADCLDQPRSEAATLTNPEPNFFILGSKSYGRNSNFLFSVGLDQIRELFALLGGRANLDLYATAQCSTKPQQP